MAKPSAAMYYSRSTESSVRVSVDNREEHDVKSSLLGGTQENKWEKKNPVQEQPKEDNLQVNVQIRNTSCQCFHLSHLLWKK